MSEYFGQGVNEMKAAAQAIIDAPPAPFQFEHPGAADKPCRMNAFGILKEKIAYHRERLNEYEAMLNAVPAELLQSGQLEQLLYRLLSRER